MWCIVIFVFILLAVVIFLIACFRWVGLSLHSMVDFWPVLLQYLEHMATWRKGVAGGGIDREMMPGGAVDGEGPRACGGGVQ
jgi:hypothetical protein